VGSTAAGALLKVDNDGAGTALDLRVGTPTDDPATKTVAPMKVDSQQVVTNLNSDKVDGRDSTDFVRGPGQAAGHALDLPEGSGGTALFDFTELEGLGSTVAYNCPNPTTSQGTLTVLNDNDSSMNLFSDNGLADPVHTTIASGARHNQATNPSGEHITVQVWQGSRLATIEVFSVHSANECHVQAQALVTP
jgi:hypothetical protein